GARNDPLERAGQPVDRLLPLRHWDRLPAQPGDQPEPVALLRGGPAGGCGGARLGLPRQRRLRRERAALPSAAACRGIPRAAAVGRMVAEAGTPAAIAPISPQEVLFAFTGPDVLARRQLVTFAWFRMFDERFYDNPAIHQLTGMRLVHDSPRGRRGLHLALAVAAVVGILGG